MSWTDDGSRLFCESGLQRCQVSGYCHGCVQAEGETGPKMQDSEADKLKRLATEQEPH